MEEIKKPVNVVLPSVRLYAEDIEKIDSILNESNFTSAISTDDYFFTVDEIKDLKQKLPKELKITAISNSSNSDIITITFNKGLGIEIYCSSNENVVLGTFYKLEKYLKNSKRVLGFIANHPTTYGFMVSFPLGIFLVLMPMALFMKNDIVFYLSIFVVFVCVSLIIAIFIFGVNKINLNKKEEVTGFLYRNKDRLILITITAIIGYLFGKL